MYRFIETLKIENRKICSPVYHISRFLKTIEIFFPESDPPDLEGTVTAEFNRYCLKHNNTPSSTLKCRIIYSEKIESVEFIPYEMKQIRNLKTVSCDRIDYSYKYSDRADINSLMESREGCDDILIIKNNMVTDSSFSNVVFFDGEKYLTPDKPLLRGTKRQKLIDEKIIIETKITADDIRHFEYATLINAMIDLDTVKITVDNVF